MKCPIKRVNKNKRAYDSSKSTSRERKTTQGAEERQKGFQTKTKTRFSSDRFNYGRLCVHEGKTRRMKLFDDGLGEALEDVASERREVRRMVGLKETYNNKSR